MVTVQPWDFLFFYSIINSGGAGFPHILPDEFIITGSQINGAKGSDMLHVRKQYVYLNCFHSSHKRTCYGLFFYFFKMRTV
ncbi:hypothetical protein DHU18_14010 [Salmonella enterica]|nr:hypothetical protein [Salmonella enterica]